MDSFTFPPIDRYAPTKLDVMSSHDDVFHFNLSCEEVFHLLLWSAGMQFRFLSSTEKTEGSFGLSEVSHLKWGGLLTDFYLSKGNASPKLRPEVAFLKKPDLFLCDSTTAGSCCQYLLLSLDQEHYQQVYGLLMLCQGLLILSGSWYLRE